MEILKSKKVIIYLVVVLLISTGISYAYFTATSTVKGKGASLTSKTADPATATVEAEGIVSFNDNDMYPGHKELVKVKVTGTGANEPIIFDLIFKGTNTFNSNIKYTIYKTTTDEQASISCTPKTKVENGKQLLYETCTENISSLGSSISTGSITKSTEEQTTQLKQDEVILTKENGNSLYYYIVIEYENVTDISKAQNNDKTSSINGKITIEESKTKYEKPNVTLTASTQQNSESTNNGWYKTVSISGTIEGTGTKYTGQYCIDTTNTCEPNKNLTINGTNITAIPFSNNANEQVLCMKLKDEYDQEISLCSNDKYKVDNEVPTVQIKSMIMST